MKKSLLTLILASMFTLTACTTAADTKDNSDVTPTETAIEATTEEVTKAPTEPPTENLIEDISATEKKFTCYVDEQRVGGRLYHPEGKGPFPTVVMIAGGGANYYSITEEAMKLVEAGNAVITPDCRGHAMVSSVSDGNFSEMTPSKSVKDIMTVIDFISESSFIDMDNIFIWGFSIGGYTATKAAIENPDTFKSLIVYDASYQMPEKARELYPEGTEIPEAANKLEHGKPFYEEMIATDIIEEMKIYNGNVLIMAGTADKDEYYIDLYTKASKAFPNAELIFLENADHDYTPYMDVIMQNTVDFVKENID